MAEVSILSDTAVSDRYWPKASQEIDSGRPSGFAALHLYIKDAVAYICWA
jgi:hypothetical protein